MSQYLNQITLNNGSVTGLHFQFISYADLPLSGAAPGSYANATVQVNDRGIVTNISSGTLPLNLGLLQNDPSFASPISNWWGVNGSELNVGGITVGPSTAAVIQQQSSGYTIGIAVMAMTTDSSGTGAGAAALNVDALANSSAASPSTRIFGLDTSCGNAGSGLIKECTSYFADGFLQNGPATTACCFHGNFLGTGTAGYTNIYGLLLDNVPAGANRWAIKTGTGTVLFGGVIQAGTTPITLTNAAGFILGPSITFDTGHNLFIGGGGTSIVIDMVHFKGIDNIGIGDVSPDFGIVTPALNAITNGSGNVALGNSALTLLTTGNSNVAIGEAALSSITTNSNNMAVGNSALSALTTGSGNVAMGQSTLPSLTSGSSNTAVGPAALLQLTSGDDNIGIGDGAGGTNPFSSTSCIFIGQSANPSANNLVDSIAIGHSASFQANTAIAIGKSVNALGLNSIAIGNGAVASSTNGFAFGAFSIASSGVSVGAGATSAASAIAFLGIASGTVSIAIGSGTTASNTWSMAFGQSATATHTSYAFGAGATTTRANQLVIGGSSLAINEINFQNGTPRVTVDDAATNAVSNNWILRHSTSGTAAAGFGSSLVVEIDSSTTVGRTASEIQTTWATATDATRKARITINAWDTAIREVMRGEASGSAPMIGFLGASAALQQTGDVGTALVTFGLMSGTPTYSGLNLSGVANKNVTADVTTTSSAQSNVTGLSFAIAASEVWTVEFDLYCSGSLGGMQFQLTGPASPTFVRVFTLGDTTGVTAVSSDSQTAFSTPTQSYVAAAFSGVVRIMATVENGANAGTVQLQFASTVNTQSNTVLRGSKMTARRVS